MTCDSLSKTTQVGTGPEAELLLLCARTQIDRERAEHIRTLLGEDLDWDYLLATSLQLGVMPLLYRSLNCTFPEAVPKAVLDELRDYFNSNTYRYLRMLREYCSNVRRAIKNKEDRDLLLLPQTLSFLCYPFIFLYYLLWPIWRIGKYGLRRLQIITKSDL